jgi:hypothetical protein
VAFGGGEAIFVNDKRSVIVQICNTFIYKNSFVRYMYQIVYKSLITTLNSFNKYIFCVFKRKIYLKITMQTAYAKRIIFSKSVAELIQTTSVN